jgi:hypothetical protein
MANIIVFIDKALTAERRQCTFAFGVEETLLHGLMIRVTGYFEEIEYVEELEKKG